MECTISLEPKWINLKTNSPIQYLFAHSHVTFQIPVCLSCWQQLLYCGAYFVF